jgi:Protein of unknown function (DUF1194)
MARPLSVFLALALSVAAGPRARAEEPVDLALVLAVDSSGSVNPYEFDLQMRGLAEAFRSPGVLNAIRSAAPNGIAVNLMQWSSTDEQGQAFGWLVVRDAQSAERVADLIDRTPRLVKDGATAISAALEYATRLHLGVEAKRHVIDVSGDGRDNQSGEVLEGRVKAVAAGITVNGLAILNEDPLLEFYYLSEIIGGEGAFVLGADDYDDFAQAIEIKLIKEISSAPLSDRRTSWPSYAARLPE